MPQERETPEHTDLPEPEQALAGAAERTPDHAPTDQDDREVLLDEPEQPVPPIDDEDRDPAARQPGDGI
jgi:hypothetical protein